MPYRSLQHIGDYERIGYRFALTDVGKPEGLSLATTPGASVVWVGGFADYSTGCKR